MKRIAFPAMWCVVVTVLGCQPATQPLPKTYPVSGTVVYQDDVSLKGGNVQFESAADSLLRISGEIQGDGTFKLRTVKGDLQGNGVPEGEYQVVVQPVPPTPPGGDPIAARKNVPPPITLANKIRVEAKENTFKIELPTAAPK